MTRWHREDDFSNYADNEARDASLDAYADADRHPDFDPTDEGNYERPTRAGLLGSWSE